MFEDSNVVESRLIDDLSEDSQSDISKDADNVPKEQPTEEDLLDLVNEIHIALTSEDVTSSSEKFSGELSSVLDKYAKQLKNPRQNGKDGLNDSDKNVQ
uniref:Ovule protein n=1 Tax=Strongyloides venezuelensis TaxID=75913 RepID=A0A0K0G4H1_STRVS